jgi:hypothetical protein
MLITRAKVQKDHYSQPSAGLSMLVRGGSQEPEARKKTNPFWLLAPGFLPAPFHFRRAKIRML